MSRYIIATSRAWHEDLVDRLKRSTGHDFFLISRKEDLTAARLRELSPKAVFVPHWSYLIPAEVYEGFECVIFHMTDLPYGQGGSPLQNLIVRGHKNTKISALRCEAGLDTGPIYLKRDLNLDGAAHEIFARTSKIIEEMIVEIIEENPTPQAQSGEPTAFSRRKPAESNLAPLTDLQAAYDQIRMLDAEGYPHAFLETAGLKLEFTGAAKAGDAVLAQVRITLKEKV